MGEKLWGMLLPPRLFNASPTASTSRWGGPFLSAMPASELHLNFIGHVQSIVILEGIQAAVIIRLSGCECSMPSQRSRLFIV